LINTNLLNYSKNNGVKKFFFSSSACIYPAYKQNDYNKPLLKEEDAYPAEADDGYVWEKLFSERMCRHFLEDFKLKTYVARYHNVYGPHGTWDGGREKAPAALSRKFVEAKFKKTNQIEIWGDGNQLRSFMYIDDCIEGTMKLFNSDYHAPINIGSDEVVSINEMCNILELISNTKPKRVYKLDSPQGVKSRCSENTLILKTLKWKPSIKLKNGLSKTYSWIENQYNNAIKNF
jgi:nucleoside-diphosphate-sugar epimerase